MDLCALVSIGDLELELVEGSGILVIALDPTVLSGAIDSDGRFDVASIHDLSSLGGSTELIARMDGQLDASDTAATGWAGRRLLGTLATTDIDCRWTGDFVATRP